MIIQCGEDNKEELLFFLKKEAVFNTFMIADIEIYGVNTSFMQIYAEYEDGIKFVYLKFYNNLILSGEAKYLSKQMIEQFLKEEIFIIMGKAEIVSEVAKTCNLDKYSEKNMYQLTDSKKLEYHKGYDIKVATISDVDKIYDFLMSIDGFDKLYGNKDMIINRINNNEGIHIFIEKDGGIIAHGNSAAKCELTNMLGGISTEKNSRQKGLASAIVSYLSKKIIDEGRIPCLWTENEPKDCLLTKLGYEKIGKWGTISI